MRRLSRDRYAMLHAKTAALRSKDPVYQVGAAAITDDNRVIALGYNGTAPGYKEPKDFWKNRDLNRSLILHAEQNLCSLFTRYDRVYTVAVTISPCVNCAALLCSHGVKRVIYSERYKDFIETKRIFDSYGIELRQVK